VYRIPHKVLDWHTLFEMLMEILADVEKFPKDNCVVPSTMPWKKSFMKCIGILPLMSCNKTIGKICP
jgi:hypothetical protein